MVKSLLADGIMDRYLSLAAKLNLYESLLRSYKLRPKPLINIPLVIEGTHCIWLYPKMALLAAMWYFHIWQFFERLKRLI